MKAQAHILVFGRVQGIFFRDHTRRRAGFLGLSGWVRNLPDGRVEVLAEGEKEGLEALISWLQEGPPLAMVEGLEVDWREYTGEFPGFRIVRS